jgi:hypothetical protein
LELSAPPVLAQAAAYCHYLVMILALKSLAKAALNDNLTSDTYR